MAGLFGPTPDELGAQRRQERMGMLVQMGNVPLGTLGGGTAGLLAGEALRDLGPQSEFQKQGLLQQAEEEVRGTGLNPGDPGFADAAVNALASRGLLREAQQARVMGLQMEQQQLQVQGLRQELAPDTASVQRRMEGLVLAGVDPQVAQRMAPNEKLFRSVMADLFKKDPVPALVQAYQLAKREGFPGGFVEYQTVLQRAGAGSVSVTIGDKPLSATDASKMRMPDGRPPRPGVQTLNEAVEAGATIVLPEEQAAATAVAKEEGLRERAKGPALSALDNLTNVLSDASVTDVLSPTANARREAAVNRMVEAVVQFRLPGREASDPTKLSMKGALSSQILSLGTDAGMEVVRQLKAEVSGQGQAAAGGGRRRRFNPATGQLE